MKKPKTQRSLREQVDNPGRDPEGSIQGVEADGAEAVDANATATATATADAAGAVDVTDAVDAIDAADAIGAGAIDRADAAGGIAQSVVSRLAEVVETVPGDDDITSRYQRTVTAPVDSGPSSEDSLPVAEGSRLESILESLLFAADRPLLVTDLKRLLADRDSKRITAALESLRDRRSDCGVQLVSVAGGWQLRTHPGNGAWVAKLVAARPARLSRAMMETLSIVAYRQPITRPEIDEIRGVDCGPVLRTLLDRALIRVIGKKEEVGRPILYGTTPEFLKTFSLRDLADLPTLREFHELGADDRAKVDATSTPILESLVGQGDDSVTNLAGDPGGSALPDIDSEEEESLIEALERAESAAGRASRATTDATAPGDRATASTSSEDGER